MRGASILASGRSARLLLVLLALGSGACSEAPAREETRQEFARPSFARGPDVDPLDPGIRFVDITSEAGIDFVHENGAFGDKWMPETVGSGGGFLDYDVDGLPDIFLVNGSEWPGHETGPPVHSRLYRNLGDGRFEDVTARAGLDRFTDYGMGFSAADYDADGDPDIYLTVVGTNRLLRNDGGRFVDVTREMGVTGDDPDGVAPPSWSTASVWLDYDRDGWLDLFVCNYVRWTPETDLFATRDGQTKSYASPEQYEGDTCRLYRNLGGRNFVEVTREAGVYNPDGKSLGMTVEDFDDDGWPDVAVANDLVPNFLYMNQGDGTFRNVAVDAGVAVDESGRARAGMGIDAADVTGRGRLSIAIGNFSHEPVSLYTQMGGGLFQDLAGAAGITSRTLEPLTFGLLFVDVDLDGYLDLLLANGHIEPAIDAIEMQVTFEQRPQFFRNNQRGKLEELTERVGHDLEVPTVGRGLAAADIDRDGDLDILLTANERPARLLRTDLDGPRSWLGLRLRGRHPNLDAIGALVFVYTGGHVQRRMVRTGSSYLSQSEVNPLILGLGDAALADSVVVRWPTTGQRAILRGLEAGRVHEIREAGEGR